MKVDSYDERTVHFHLCIFFIKADEDHSGTVYMSEAVELAFRLNLGRSEADIRREVEAVGTVDAGRAERHLSSSGARGEAELDFAAFSKLMAKLASQGDTDALWAALVSNALVLPAAATIAPQGGTPAAASKELSFSSSAASAAEAASKANTGLASVEFARADDGASPTSPSKRTAAKRNSSGGGGGGNTPVLSAMATPSDSLHEFLCGSARGALGDFAERTLRVKHFRKKFLLAVQREERRAAAGTLVKYNLARASMRRRSSAAATPTSKHSRGSSLLGVLKRKKRNTRAASLAEGSAAAETSKDGDDDDEGGSGTDSESADDDDDHDDNDDDADGDGSKDGGEKVASKVSKISANGDDQEVAVDGDKGAGKKGEKRRGKLSPMDKKVFSSLLRDASNSLLHPECSGVYQDMTQPMSHYWVASSHNTYLTGDQLTSNSSVQRYIDDLCEGCRCVELDCWDDAATGEPCIYHGGTMTSKIPFRAVIEAIRDFGFRESPYPIILSFENHCSPPFQLKMAGHIKDVLLANDLLWLPPESTLHPNGPGPIATELPSPEEAKGYVLIKVR